MALSPEASASSGSPTARATRRGDRSPAPSPQELAVAFPQLEIVELIGRGGMGFVYRARQTKLDRWVALKILPGHLANESSFRERFEREARVMAKLQHPQIVSVFDFGEAMVPSLNAESSVGAEHSYFYLMLEYVDGVNLREAMKAGRFTPEQALAVVPQVCEALQYAHSKGVLHRDIKPENILLDTDGRVKIADFGIAKVLGPGMDPASGEFAAGASESEVAVTRLTATGSVLGTPLYMAPEQLISPNAVDHRADIFSLGVVFYEMLTGELPMGRFAPPSEKSHVDQRIDEIVMRALAKERELRQQSANEMKSEVESIASHPRRPMATKTTPSLIPSAETREPDRPQRSRGSGVLGWLALASLPIGTFVAVLPMITLRTVRTTANGESVSVQPSWILVALMLMFTVGGTVLPVCLGWAHLLIQRAKHARAGVIPSLIAAWFVPLLVLNGMLLLVVRLEPHSPTWPVVPYAMTAFCLLVDGLILVTTWHWATRTPYTWVRRRRVFHRLESGTPPRYWGWGLIIASILIVPTLAIGGILIGLSLGFVVLSGQPASTDPPAAVEILPAEDSVNLSTNIKRRPAPSTSAAAAMARKQNLITVDDQIVDHIPRAEQPLTFAGADGDVTVEPGKSLLIKLQDNDRLVNNGAVSIRSRPAFDQVELYPIYMAYPCDHVVCDCTGDLLRIIGYLQPPGTYDFAGSPAAITQFSELSHDSQVAVGAYLLKLARGASTSVVSSNEWQQATKGEFLRCHFVPRTISGLDVPDELQVVLSRDSRTILTRTADRYTKHVLSSSVHLNRFATSMVAATNAENDSDSKRLMQRAARSIRDKQWAEFQTCLTDDCRDDWIFEALLVDAIKKESNETYSSLSQQDRRQWRIGRVRQRDNPPQDFNFVRACRSKLLPTYLSQWESIPIFMPLGNELAIGNATDAGGRTVAIVLRSVNLDGAQVWRIDSFFKSSYDPPTVPPPADAIQPENQQMTPPAEAAP